MMRYVTRRKCWMPVRVRESRATGFTLVEVLVAAVISLIMMYAVAQLFAVISETVSANRATVELAGQMRGALMQIDRDLRGVTVPVRTWQSNLMGLGYFEYFEGPEGDYRVKSLISDVPGESPTLDTSVGDCDDIMMFTCRSEGGPFFGRVRSDLVSAAPTSEYTTITSNVAEVAYWTEREDFNGNGKWEPEIGERFRLHRRVLLIRPDLPLNNVSGLPGVLSTSVPDWAAVRAFQRENDLSVRWDFVTKYLATNSLGSLSDRKNRFAHIAIPTAAGFSFSPRLDNLVGTAVDLLGGQYRGTSGIGFAQSGDFAGEDVAVSHVIGFDLKAYDPTAPLQANSADLADVIAPGDAGFVLTSPAIGHGAFVDLYYAPTAATLLSRFSGPPNPKSGLFLPTSPREYLPTYDTWSIGYENDGLDQDGVLGPDQGTNGLDDDNANGVDDAGERETAPPYDVPLRGIQIRLRVIDPDSRQVRQMTVVSDFLPE